MIRRVRAGMILVASAFTMATVVEGADWPQFRGSHFGQSSDAKPLPTKITPTDHVNVREDVRRF